jgi:hypothetical protein
MTNGELMATLKKTRPQKTISSKSLKAGASDKISVERVQIGIRLEKRMVKVLKALAEYLDVSLTELMESIVLHSFEGGGANAFMADILPKIEEIKKVYGMRYGVHDSERFLENSRAP